MAIANLLPGNRAASGFAPLDESRRARLAERLASVAGLRANSRDVQIEADFGDDLEELEVDVSTGSVEALLDRIAAIRTDRVFRLGPFEKSTPRGRFLLYRFGHSLQTGEAEIASRGFFDVSDRPPLMLWLDALSRPLSRRAGDFDIAVLVFVPEDCVERALAGRRVCPSHALCLLDEVSGGIAKQLASLLESLF